MNYPRNATTNIFEIRPATVILLREEIVENAEIADRLAEFKKWLETLPSRFLPNVADDVIDAVVDILTRRGDLREYKGDLWGIDDA